VAPDLARRTGQIGILMLHRLAGECTPEQQEVIAAAIYAVRCFIPHPPLTGRETVGEMIRWGAIRHLHDTVAAMTQATYRGDAMRKRP
jgi:hypothetical protein